MFELTNKDVERIILNLDETEKNSLPIAYSILQKIVGILIEPYSGRSEMVDIFRSVASTLSEISEKANNNG